MADAVKKVGFAADRLDVTYEWRTDPPDRVRTVLLPSAEQVRLRPYQARLAELTRSGDRAAPMSFVELVNALFQLAAERGADADAAAENRAALFVLAVYASGKGLAAAVPAAADWPRPTSRKVTLGGRVDFAQHFAISAALAAGAGGPFADAVGVYKEVDDSRRGSGFSFADIAADRAGARFGEAATASAGRRAGCRRSRERVCASRTSWSRRATCPNPCPRRSSSGGSAASTGRSITA